MQASGSLRVALVKGAADLEAAIVGCCSVCETEKANGTLVSPPCW